MADAISGTGDNVGATARVGVGAACVVHAINRDDVKKTNTSNLIALSDTIGIFVPPIYRSEPL